MKSSIGWINGEWGLIENLNISLNNRGLTLADGIFETILILQGKPKLLNKHLDRLKGSACLLGMKTPPQKEWVISLIEEGIACANLSNMNGSIRINWSRGKRLGRGINLGSGDQKHEFWIEINHGEPCFQPITTIISKFEQRNAKSQINLCKTFAYTQSINARREAQKAGKDEALLLSTNGDLSCGSASNLIIKRNNEWITPPLSTGCLPGIMRGQGLKNGIIKEAKIEIEPHINDQWLLINSLSCHPIKELNNKHLNIFKSAKSFWLELYQL